MSRPRAVMIIDLFGLSADEVRERFPEVYQHLLIMVKPERDNNARDTYRLNWWIFGEPRKKLRPALANLGHYIATVETVKHCVFQFLNANVLPDNTLVAIASDDGFILGILSSKLNIIWTLAQGGTLDDRPRYQKSLCFDPFPFPAANDLQKHRIRQIAERLDAHRKRVLAEHDHLTLTGLYNVLEKLRTGTAATDLDQADRRIFDDGLVGILRKDHDALDEAAAYGWPTNLSETETLARLVALNKERTQEKAPGQIRWLRPDYQIPKFGTAKDKVEIDLAGGTMRAAPQPATTGPKTAFPLGDLAQTGGVMASLMRASGPLPSATIAANFRQGRRILPQVEAVLAALVWDGWVSQAEGNTGFVLRKAA